MTTQTYNFFDVTVRSPVKHLDRMDHLFTKTNYMNVHKSICRIHIPYCIEILAEQTLATKQNFKKLLTGYHLLIKKESDVNVENQTDNDDLLLSPVLLCNVNKTYQAMLWDGTFWSISNEFNFDDLPKKLKKCLAEKMNEVYIEYGSEIDNFLVKQGAEKVIKFTQHGRLLNSIRHLNHHNLLTQENIDKCFHLIFISLFHRAHVSKKDITINQSFVDDVWEKADKLQRILDRLLEDIPGQFIALYTSYRNQKDGKDKLIKLLDKLKKLNVVNACERLEEYVMAGNEFNQLA